MGYRGFVLLLIRLGAGLLSASTGDLDKAVYVRCCMTPEYSGSAHGQPLPMQAQHAATQGVQQS